MAKEMILVVFVVVRRQYLEMKSATGKHSRDT